jgi:putative transposase
MDQKTSNKIHYLERKARRIQHHMDNKFRINKERVKNGELISPYTKNYNKLRFKFRKIWKKITNIRKHWHYNTCKWIVTRYKKIYVDRFETPDKKEHLGLPNKVKRKFNYINRFHSMYNFNEVLVYMCDKYGCEYNQAKPKTTCTCSVCGHVNPHLDLSERYLVCEECNSKIDRDYNAAKNCYEFS